MKLSIIIPVFNEENTFEELIDSVKRVKLPDKISKEIIVIDDGSHDSTPKLIRKTKGIRRISHRRNKGKGAAVISGINSSSGEIVIIQDADLEYDPNYFPKLIKPIIERNKKVVYGTRLANYPLKLFGRNKTPLPFHYVGNKVLTTITNTLYRSNITDMETCYKVFTREVIKDLKLVSMGFEIEPEITAKILKAGHTIHEVPIKVKPRGYDEGKKITWKDAIVAVRTLVKYRVKS